MSDPRTSTIALAMELGFWILLGVVAWVYAGYPLLLALVSRIRRLRIDRAPISPSVSVIIAAYNEQKDIAQKLERTLSLEYPPEKLEVIVASDCSTDGTHGIVAGFADRGVQLQVLAERGGKTAAQNFAARHARGEILVFTDATTRLRPDALSKLMEGFADPRVGCVGAELDYVSEAGSVVGRGAGLYWRYEKKVKELESTANSLIGVSGCLYAVRSHLYSPIDPDLISDFVIAPDMFARGYVTAYAPGTIVEEITNEDTAREFEMRTRVIVQSIHVLVRRFRMLNPLRYGLFAVQLWSHKVLRYLVAELLGGALVLSLALALQGGPRARLYQVLAAVQLGGYALTAALHWLLPRFAFRGGPLYAPVYFAQANAAAVWALVQYLRGERKITWTTAR